MNRTTTTAQSGESAATVRNAIPTTATQVSSNPSLLTASMTSVATARIANACRPGLGTSVEPRYGRVRYITRAVQTGEAGEVDPEVSTGLMPASPQALEVRGNRCRYGLSRTGRRPGLGA